MIMQAKRISVYHSDSVSVPGTKNLTIQITGTMPDGTTDSCFASGNGKAKVLVVRTLEGYGIHKADVAAGVLPEGVGIEVLEGLKPDGAPKLDLVLVGSDAETVSELFSTATPAA